MALSLKIRWPSHGPAKSYNIYFRRIDESSFTKANSVPLIDNTDANIFIIPQIAPNTEYWIYVVECSNGIDIPECLINSEMVTPILNKIRVKTYS
jgi:hypothetical protein